MRGGIQALVAGVMLIANAGVVGRPATQAPGPRPAPCGQVDAITLLSYGIDGSVGNVHLQIIPDGARWFFRLTPQGGASASTPEYSGHLRVTRKISHAVDLVAQNPVAASTGGVQVRQATLPLRVRVDVGRALLTGQVVVGGRTRGIAIPLADAPGLAALACALPLIRARRWDNLYAHMALEYRRRYSRHAMAAALGNGAALVSATQPPNWTMGRQTAAPAAQFWGGRNLVAEFLTLRTGVEQATTVALYALRVGKDWTLVVAPPLACTLVTSKSGPFTCAIGLVTSDALGSYHLLVDGYNSGDGGLFPGQFAVINATLPWELEPGNHTVELRSDTQGSNAPDVGTAPITIPGAPTTPCPRPAAGVGAGFVLIQKAGITLGGKTELYKRALMAFRLAGSHFTGSSWGRKSVCRCNRLNRQSVSIQTWRPQQALRRHKSGPAYASPGPSLARVSCSR